MNYKYRVSSNSYFKNFQLVWQPAQAWSSILGLVLFTVFLVLIGAGKILNFAFPASTCAVGILLYFRYPVIYIGFTWWIFFLTPLIRRLADYSAGFSDPSPILLTPYLVVLITLVSVWQNFPRVYRQGALPFLLSFIGLFYGFLIGTINLPLTTVGIALLDWLVPVLFGFYLFVNWRDYLSYRQNIERTFTWGVLVMGAYGIFQYLVAPEWDRLWLIETGLRSMGNPEPLKIRVWSTLNSSGVFAIVMMAGLLILLNSKNKLRIPAMVVGYLSFLLSLVRSAWGGWFVGLLALLSSLKANSQMRIISVILTIGLLVIPFAIMEPFSGTLNQRFETLSNIEEDGSGLGRQQTYKELMLPALSSFVGKGIGSEAYDSAILNMLLHLGWPGTIPYVSGMLLLLFKLSEASKNRFDSFINNANSISLAIVSQLVFGSPMIETMGVVLWGFLGIGLAGNKYYQYQNLLKLKNAEIK